MLNINPKEVFRGVFFHVLSIVFLMGLLFPMVSCNSADAKDTVPESASSGPTDTSTILVETPVKLSKPSPSVERVVTLGDLMGEDFAHLEAYCGGENRLSGWDMETSGGNYKYEFYESFKVSDTNNSAPFIMKKRFVRQATGKTTWEYKFKMPEKMNDVTWQLRSGSVPVVVIRTNQENLCYENARGEINKIFTYHAHKEYLVKVVVDMDTKKFDLYINGKPESLNVDFRNTTDHIDYVYIQTGHEATGDMYIGPIYVYTGYQVRERFLVSEGPVPADWILSTKGGTITIQDCGGARTNMDKNSMCFKDLLDSASSAATKTFSKSADKLVCMYKWMPGNKNGVRMQLQSGETTAVEIVTANNNLCYVDAKGQRIPVWNNYRKNVWYDVKIVADPVTNKADIYINTMKRGENVAFVQNVNDFDSIRFESSVKGTGVVWVDDVVIHPYQPYPTDYVPEPVVVDTGDYIVGIQSCDLWREGVHNGWSFIQDEESVRKPYLGWYNGGDSEVEDWAVKWMAENGIAFDFKCWYRKARGAPIHSTLSNEGLYGYRYGRWSHKVKYAINFVNHPPMGVADMDDWKQNVVPHLIEHYFVDPRYQKIDNKLVFGIYDPNRLNDETGDVGTAIKYLKSECKKAGFDGVFILGQHWHADKKKLTNYKKWGIDAIYAYTWFARNAEEQKDIINEQRDLGVIDVLPTLTMGWDYSAWGGKEVKDGHAGQRRYWLKPDEFQELAQWAKDVFMPSYPSGSQADLVVILDNWNEYGEGHFIMPAKLHGFGYVNAIRNVFGKGKFPPNVIPTKKQKARLDTLYPKGDW